MSIAAMNWAWDVIGSQPLSASEKLVLLALAHRHNAKSGACNPSHTTLAKMVGMSRRRVISTTASLEEKKVLDVVKRTVRGAKVSNQYVMGGSALSVTRGSDGGGTSERRGGVVPSASHNKEEYITNRAGVDVDLEKSASDGTPISHLRLVAGGAPC